MKYLGAVVFSIVIGLSMALIFRKEEKQKIALQMAIPEEEITRPLWQNSLYFLSMVGILVFANWGKPQETYGIWATIYSSKWIVTSAFTLLFGVILIWWFKVEAWKIITVAILISIAAFLFPIRLTVAFTIGFIGLSIITNFSTGETGEWFFSSWGFAKQILPLLLIGVLIAGALLGKVGNEGLIPSECVAKAVGGNSLQANFFASFAGAFMYFATLTEVPMLQGLLANGMGKGSALTLLLAGPALSLPNMLVIRSVLGTKKTAVFVGLVVVMATISGMVFGTYF